MVTKASVSTKAGNCIDQLSKYTLFKEGPASWTESVQLDK